ncbi:MAG: Two component transcriptional regulator, winged helix family [candidate division WWE3 bacterium GW2011_GWC1_47_10]|uniref:Two component transcriptional regulator, winged helix family n=1 Tax=candidate division WWE3 bacterium GW2011_GWC1_47_10 TaxID=1619122 RepID=A0A0G1QXL7_UNCKA|nr:MAG: Two component transcriptional regulator, winged helix family [candidate division WWE3 bacterium GW2011_GWC1_47_10]
MNKKILIIEDEADIRDLYCEFLKANKFDVVAVEDGQMGLDLAARGEWDLILLDIMLPKVDGLELLRVIKSNGVASNIPVILLTNLEKDEILEKCLELGAKKYLVKSGITPQDLLEAVNSVLSDKTLA